MKYMTEGRPGAVIMRFMIPVLLGNLFQLTYSLADIHIVGRFLGDQALAGVGATSTLHTLYIGFFMGIANGYAITIAQLFGARFMERVRVAFAAALLLGGCLSVSMVGLTMLFLKNILRFLNVPNQVFSTSYSYISIIIVGMILTMFYDILITASRAIGDSKTPLMILMLSVGLNILGDIVLLGIMRTSVRGAAIATVGAQFIAFLVCAVYLLRKYPCFRVKRADFGKIELSMVKEMMAMGLSMGFMSSLISIGSLILQTAINSLGESYIVAQTAARKMTEALMSIFVAMGQTLTTYCGQNYGARKYQRIKAGMRFGYLVTCSWCVLVLIVAYTIAPACIRMITGSQDVVMIEASSKYLRIDCILYVLVAIIFVQRNSLQGLGEKRTPLFSSGIEMVGKIILTYTLVPKMGYNGVILVEPIVWIVMIVPLIVKMRQITRQEAWSGQDAVE